MMNDPYAPQTDARAPRLRVIMGNNLLGGVISASVTSNNYYQADHFNLSFATSASVIGWWDINPPMVLNIQVSIGDAGWRSLIIGEVDHQHFHIQTGVLQMEGRDLSARLIETKTQEAFVNQTSSQIAAILASRHKMRTNAITATTTQAGRYYAQDHSNITLGQFSRTTTEWDLLVYLAQRENFDVFMVGNVLHFQPTTLPSADPYILNWSAESAVPRMNGVSLDMERSLTLAKDVQVEVRSWNSRQERSFTKTARAIGGRASSATDSGKGKPTNTQKYVFVRPNLSEDQAQQLANQMAKDITLHERVINDEMPGELVLTSRNLVKLQGTKTSFDQTYFIDHIERSISFGEGFRQHIRMKNSSPRTQTQV